MTDIKPTNTKLPNPWISPSYPRRVHVRERGQLQSLLAHWEVRIEEARSQLASTGPDPARSRLYSQMLGARDQIADAVRRMPMEVGDLYANDDNRLKQAVASLERLFDRWSNTQGAPTG